MFELSPDDEQILIRETARRFAETELRGPLRDHERTGAVGDAAAARFAETALAAIELPNTLGGGGLGATAKALVLEELAAVDPGAAVALDGLGPALYALLESGEIDLLRRVAGRGVVLEDLDGRFRIEGDVVTGEAPWIPARSPAVAVIDRGDRALVVTDGLGTTAATACGLEATGGARLRLERAPIAATIRDRRAVERARARTRIWIASLLVGAARGAYDYARSYARERVAFGRPIAHHQALAFLIADMATAVDVARLCVWRAARAVDAGGSAAWEAAAAFAEAAEQALFVAPNAVQILGGHGFMKDHPVEKWMRDVRTLASLAGGRDAAEIDAAALVPERELGLS